MIKPLVFLIGFLAPATTFMFFLMLSWVDKKHPMIVPTITGIFFCTLCGAVLLLLYEHGTK